MQQPTTVHAPDPGTPTTGGLAGLLRVHHGREIIALATPTVLAMFSQTLMWTVDTIFLGHVSSLALAAAGLGGILAWTAYSLFNNLSRISGTFVAQAHGRGDDEAVGDYTWQTLYIAFGAGLLLTLLGVLSHHVLVLTRNPAEVQAAAHDYIKWRMMSAVFTQAGFTLMGFFQGRRRVHVPMWAGIAANVLNVVFDIWLIFGWRGMEIGGRHLLAAPALGVTGAAMATSIAATVNFLILAVWMVAPAENRRRFRIHRPRRPDPRRILRLVRIGLPSAAEGFADMGSFALFTVIIGMTGTVSLAAANISVQMLSFSFMPMWGLTIAGSVLTGNWLGKGDPDAAAAYGRQVFKLGLYYTLFVATILLALNVRIYRLFTPDPEVLAFAGGLVAAVAFFQVGDSMRMVGSGLLTGAGDTRFNMVVSLAVGWGIFIPLTWLLIVRLGGSVVTAWVGGAACYCLQGVLFWLRFRGGRWRRIRIFGDDAHA